jgi:hypothetical protein
MQSVRRRKCIRNPTRDLYGGIRVLHTLHLPVGALALREMNG